MTPEPASWLAHRHPRSPIRKQYCRTDQPEHTQSHSQSRSRGITVNAWSNIIEAPPLGTGGNDVSTLRVVRR